MMKAAARRAPAPKTSGSPRSRRVPLIAQTVDHGRPDFRIGIGASFFRACGMWGSLARIIRR